MKWPRIRSRRTTEVSPWVSIIAREVEFSRGAAPQVYHAVEQPDYISIVALTRSGKIPIVRQYRPALEAYAWELPAGLVDPGGDRAADPQRRLSLPAPHRGAAARRTQRLPRAAAQRAARAAASAEVGWATAASPLPTRPPRPPVVMPGLDPGIHRKNDYFRRRGWIAGSSPAMTETAWARFALPTLRRCPHHRRRFE